MSIAGPICFPGQWRPGRCRNRPVRALVQTRANSADHRARDGGEVDHEADKPLGFDDDDRFRTRLGNYRPFRQYPVMMEVAARLIGGKTMAMPQAKATIGRKKTRQRVDLFYALAIESWEWSYSFGVAGRERDAERVYADGRHLHVGGTLSHPHKSAGRRINLAFVLSDGLLGKTAHLYQRLPDDVGTVH